MFLKFQGQRAVADRQFPAAFPVNRPDGMDAGKIECPFRRVTEIAYRRNELFSLAVSRDAPVASV